MSEKYEKLPSGPICDLGMEDIANVLADYNKQMNLLKDDCFELWKDNQRLHAEIERLKEQLASQQDMVDLYATGEAEAKREAIELRRQLATAEKRGMERAIEIADNWRDDGSDKWVGRQIANAIRAEMEKLLEAKP